MSRDGLVRVERGIERRVKRGLGLEVVRVAQGIPTRNDIYQLRSKLQRKRSEEFVREFVSNYVSVVIWVPNPLRTFRPTLSS